VEMDTGSVALKVGLIYAESVAESKGLDVDSLVNIPKIHLHTYRACDWMNHT
jgi:hypothetical protein